MAGVVNAALYHRLHDGTSHGLNHEGIDHRPCRSCQLAESAVKFGSLLSPPFVCRSLAGGKLTRQEAKFFQPDSMDLAAMFLLPTIARMVGSHFLSSWHVSPVPFFVP